MSQALHAASSDDINHTATGRYKSSRIITYLKHLLFHKGTVPI